MRFPSYLPDGYEYKCGIHYDHFNLLQTHRNQSIPKIEDLAASSTREEALNKGVIQIFAIRAVPLWYEWANKTAEHRLEELMAEGDEGRKYYLEPRLVHIFGQTDHHKDANADLGAVTYRHNSYLLKDINILEVYDHGRSEAYILKGKVPLNELVKMAKSMYLQ